VSVFPFSALSSLFPRQWDAYDLERNTPVCAASEVTSIQGAQACVSPCVRLPEIEPTFMICAITEGVDLETVIPGPPNPSNGNLGELYTWCVCIHEMTQPAACLCLFLVGPSLHVLRQLPCPLSHPGKLLPSLTCCIHVKVRLQL
jgi:hypothetical protein